ncbi:MAG: hypothetical protein GXO83_13340 [Chlorobi bacterium]|nr:hypothetical protein [Chlorobiota bacterium]
MGKVLFHEKQYFRQPAIWLLVALTDLFVLYSLIYIVWIDPGKEDLPALWAIAGSLLLCVVMTVMFMKTALETTVTTDEISYRFTWFQRKTRVLTPAEVSRWEIREISPAREFGGYGVKKSRKDTSFLVSGKKAVIFTLTDGEKVIIGTQKPQMLQMALSQVFKASEENEIH